MSFLENLKLNNWWSLLIYIGFLGMIGSFFMPIIFVDPKNIFGLSLGLLLVGVATLSAIKTAVQFKEPNIYTGGAGMFSWKVIKYNFLSGLITFIGTLLTIIFIAKIIIGLF